MLRKLYTPHGAASKIGKQPQGTHWARRTRQLEDLLGRPCNNQHSGGDVQRQLALKDLQPVTQTNTGKGTYSDGRQRREKFGAGQGGTEAGRLETHTDRQTRNTWWQTPCSAQLTNGAKSRPGRTRVGGQSNARQYKQAALPLKLGPQ